jgi:hypothetical protein
MDILFPVRTVKWRNFERRNARRVQAVRIDADFTGVGPRHIEGLDATMAAEVVLRNTCIKRVCFDIVLAGEQAKIILGYDQMQVAGHPANTAVALVSHNIGRRLNLELHLATVASSLV